MKKNKLFNIVSNYFCSYKMSFTMVLLGLSAVLSVFANKHDMVYLVLAILPVLIWVILVSIERNGIHLKPIMGYI